MDILDILLDILLKPPQPFIGLFLCVEWDTPQDPIDTPLGHNWIANQNARFQLQDNKKQEDGGHFIVTPFN